MLSASHQLVPDECRPIYTPVFVFTSRLDIADDVGILGKVVSVHEPISDVRSKASICLFTPSRVSRPATRATSLVLGRRLKMTYSTHWLPRN